MRSGWKEILYALFMGAVVPWLLLSFAVMVMEREKPVISPTNPSLNFEAAETVPESEPLTMRLRSSDGSVKQMNMDAYLVGVVLAEMPASFEPEALKAQAVVARTYTRRACETGGKHGDGSVCSLYSCCQAYITEEAYLEKGGSPESVEKVRSAVYATSGYVLTYEGMLIEATYFSCSGGLTEDAKEVWGTDYPYLQSVESPGEESAVYHTDSKIFSAREFQEALGISLNGTPETWFGTVTYTVGQGVDTMMIGGLEYRGTELRTRLDLRSTAFSIEVKGDTIMIHTKGYGHRVGMSQYGADAMAVNGSTFGEILAYYYQGTELYQLKE